MKNTSKKLKWRCCLLASFLTFGFVNELQANHSQEKSIEQQGTNQNRRVQGNVSDENGDPLIGVSVMVKNDNIGTITDIDGNFTFNVPDNSVLIVSYIGYATQEISVGTREQINIIMKEDAKALDEVVVVGFGSQKKVNLTGAVSTVDSKAFENRAVANVSQALQGVMPGLNITQSKGFLDESPSINIRGVGTIGEGSDASPLVLIDGIEGDINRLNPQDIETVSVLKDAAASSIYGSRAPFGVILITTKKGKEGKLSATYSNSFRWQKPINMPETVDSYTFATYFNETATNGGTAGHFSPERLQKIRDYMDGKISGGIDPNPDNPTVWLDLYDHGYANTNWFDVMFKNTTFAQEHNVSVSGGTDKLRVYASANFMDQGGMIKLNPESNQRISTNLKVTGRLSKYVEFTYGIRYNNTRFEKPTNLGDSFFSQLTRQGWPTLVSHDPNGHLYAYATWTLPLRDGGQSIAKTDEAIHSFNLLIEPAKGWRILGDLNYSKLNKRTHSDTQKMYNHNVNEELVQYTLSGKNTKVKEEFLGTQYFNPNLYTDYQNGWRGHHFKIMGGFQAEMLKKDEFTAERLGIIVPDINVIDGTSGTDGDGKAAPPVVSGKVNKWATVGFFGRLNYDYHERYLLEFNMRYDGTSRFRKDKRWKAFPSFSLGWNIARESFFESYTDLISMLKIRGSWGKLGNQNTKDIWYPTYLTIPIETAKGEWLINGNKPNKVSAPGIISTTMGWESIRTINLGVDVNMLNNRLGVTFEAFKRSTDDMIGPAPEMPVTLGTDVPKTNNTDLVTKGWELSVSWRDRLGFGLGYNIGMHLSDAQTEITNYPDKTGTVTKNYTGKKLGEIWGFETVGIAKTDEEMNQHLATLPNGGQDRMGNNWAAGDIMYKDLNGDGKIDWGNSTYDDLGDMKVIGNSSPRYAFGVSLGADYKGFDLSMFFQGIMKRDYVHTSSQDFWGAGGGLWDSTVFKQHLDYFRNDPEHHLGQNLDSYYPRPLWSDKNKHAQTRYVISAAYMRLKNLTLGYTLPATFTRKLNIENLRISFTGENLFTITDTPSFYDPETLDSNDGRITYPLSKVFSLGLSVTF